MSDTVSAGALSVQLSAPTDTLKRDMDQAAQIVLQGSARMADAAQQATSGFEKTQSALTTLAEKVGVGENAIAGFAGKVQPLLAALGPAGPIAGIALGIGSVVAALVSWGQEQDRLAANTEALAKVEETFRAGLLAGEEILETQTEKTKRLAEARREAVVAANAEAQVALVVQEREIRTQLRPFIEPSPELNMDPMGNFQPGTANTYSNPLEEGAMNARLASIARAREQLEKAARDLSVLPLSRFAPAEHAAAAGAERQPGDPEGVLERLRLAIDHNAQSVVDSVDPAAKALKVYQDGIQALAQAQQLFRDTQDRDGGPLGLSSERVIEVSTALKTQYLDALEKVQKAEAGTTTATDGAGTAFRRIESSFENAIVGGKSLSDIFKALEQDLAKLVLRLAVTEPAVKALKDAFNGAGGVSGIFGKLFASNGGTKVGDVGAEINVKPPAADVAFANGGIMSSMGPIPLRAYANGGVADRPQAAIFGEGSMNEAFVPLPDGRSIPVSMQGGGRSGDTYIDARGADVGVERRIQAAMAQAALQGAAMGEQRVYAAANRGGAEARLLGRRR